MSPSSLHQTWVHFLGFPRDLQACVIAWVAIVGLQLYGNSQLQIQVRYGIISYKFTKTLIAAIFGFIAVATLLGGAGTPSYRIGFTVVALVMTYLDFLHIHRRNRNENFLLGKTTLGLVNFENKEDVELAISSAASIVRHQRYEGKEYASEKSLEELLDAFGVPSISEHAERLREEAKLLREKRARDNIFAADVEMMRKEIQG